MGAMIILRATVLDPDEPNGRIRNDDHVMLWVLVEINFKDPVSTVWIQNQIFRINNN